MINLKHQYFFCYSPTLHKFIHSRHNIRFICTAKNESDNRKFWLYERTEELKVALDDYKAIFKGVDANWLYRFIDC